MSDDLIYDKGKLRNCQANKAKMGWWKVSKEFYSYGETLRDLSQFLFLIWEAGSAFVVYLVALPFLILMLPINPFIRGIFDYRRSVKAVKIQNKVKGIKE